MDEQLPDSDGVLPNRLGITDPEVLKTAEAEVCHIRTVELAVKPVGGSFDFAHLQRIHARLFGDIYDFAGKVRTVDMSKGHTTFCRAAYIDASQRRLFGELRIECFLRGLGKPELARRLAYYASELNAIHPFRDGNGRAIRIFLQQLAASAGYDLAYRDADEEGLMRADIAAFGGNYEQLESIYASILRPLSDHS